MVKQSDLVKTESLEDCGSHGNTDDEFEEYSEEEMLGEEESDEKLCMPPEKEGSRAEEPNEDSSSDEESAEEVSCGDESDDEGSCPEEPNEEDPDEEPETASAEYLTKGTASEEASDEDPSDVSFEEIVEEEFYEESDEEPNEEEPLRGFMDQLPTKASDHIFSESKTSAESSGNQCLRESTNLSTDAIVSKQPDDPLASSKKRRSRWDIKADDPMLVNESVDLDIKKKTRWSSDTKAEAPILVNNNTGLNKRRKTRWSSDETQLNMSCTLNLPDSLKDILSDTCNDKHIQRLIAKLQEINQKLEGSVIDAEPQGKSSPSSQPLDTGLDSSVDTREFKIRLKLLKQKQKIISELLTKSKKKDEPKDLSKHPHAFSKKLYIPLKEYPNYNFVGLILGPNGNTLKKMEKETGATFKLRGKGSNLKEKKDQVSQDELHVLIQSDSQTCLDAAVSMIEKIFVPVDDRYNYRKAAQLRELAELRGTLNEGSSWVMKPCDICGNSSHPTSDCPLIATTSKTNANFHTGSGSLFSSFKSPLSPPPLPFVAKAYGDKSKKEINPANLFIGFLPQSVSTDKLKELFLPFGSIRGVVVMMNKSTGRSKGWGFVKYTTASDAAKAIEKMNGYLIDGKKLAVRIAGTPQPLNTNLPNYPGPVSIPTPFFNANLPNFPGLASITPPSSNVNLPNYLGILPSTSNANLLPNYPVLASTPPSNANLPNYPGLASIPQEIPKPNCWPGPPGSLLLESSVSFPKSSYNSLTYTKTVPLQSSTSLGSTFQTASLGKNGHTMDGKKLNVTVVGTPPPSLSANLPNYPGFAAVPREIPEPNYWPRPPGSILPESDAYFPKSNYNSLKYTEGVPFRSSTYLGSTSQTSISSSQFSGAAASSDELSSFPGYLKSFDPPVQLDKSIPSSSLLSSRAPYFTGNFSGNQMNPTWR